MAQSNSKSNKTSSKKVKILILLADVAAGHRSAAIALEAAAGASRFRDKCEIVSLDIFKLADIEPFNSLETVHTLVSENRWAEKFVDFWVQLTNLLEPIYDIYHWYMAARLLPRFKKIVDSEQPDVILSVHPFASMMLYSLKKSNPGRYKTATAITDLVSFYRGWADREADLIFAPTHEAASRLEEFRVSSDRIEYPLFPINPNYKKARSKREVLKELGFSQSKKIILVTGGGLGLTSMLKVIDKLSRHEDWQVIVIAGKREFLKSQLEGKYADAIAQKRLAIFSFVGNFQDYLNLADVIVTKPGPATILEIELFQKPAVLTRPVGHQEQGNIRYALENPNLVRVGESFNNIEEIISNLLELKKEYRRRSFEEANTIIEKLLKLGESKQ
ncbi:MAG: MGDG synthase family glycosyltransferase [Candidatus Dojkabacteria bacterium]